VWLRDDNKVEVTNDIGVRRTACGSYRTHLKAADAVRSVHAWKTLQTTRTL
jgi:hypothetical protein